MSAQTDEYDKMSKEEREEHDKADRAREAQEQAGRSQWINLYCSCSTNRFT